MISKEEVYKYLSEGLIIEGLFDSKPKNQNTGDIKSDPDLSWHFNKDVMILFSGSSSTPKSQYYPFSDEIRYAEFEDRDKDNSKDDKDKKGVFTKDFKTGLKNFALAAMTGGVTAATVDAADKALNKIDKNKKDKNGNSDKWIDAAVTSFTNLNDFKAHAEKNHVPSSMINDFINTYKGAKAGK